MRTRLVGRFNVSNWLAAYAAATYFGATSRDLVQAAAAQPPVPGRMNLVDAGQPFAVVVDFAHTPQALEKALDTVRSLVSGRILLAFGLAGGRDFANRPVMGALAARRLDFFAITMDDPGDEDPAAIAEQIAAGAAIGRSRAFRRRARSTRGHPTAVRACRGPAMPCCWRAKATSSAWSWATSDGRGTTRAPLPRCSPNWASALKLYHDGRAAAEPKRAADEAAETARHTGALARISRSRCRRPSTTAWTDHADTDAGARRADRAPARPRRPGPYIAADPGLYAMLGLDPAVLRRGDPDGVSPPGGQTAQQRCDQHARHARAERRLRSPGQPGPTRRVRPTASVARRCGRVADADSPGRQGRHARAARAPVRAMPSSRATPGWVT